MNFKCLVYPISLMLSIIILNYVWKHNFNKLYKYKFKNIYEFQ